MTPRCLPFSDHRRQRAEVWRSLIGGRARSGLITFQLLPASVDLNRTLAAKYSAFGSTGKILRAAYDRIDIATAHRLRCYVGNFA